MPAHALKELEYGFQRAFPRCLRIDHDKGPFWLRYRVSVRHNDYSDYGVSTKEFVGWVELQDRRIGMIQIDEWYVAPAVEDITFWNAADSWSQGTANFGSAVLSAWPVAKLASHGPLVELSRVWMHPDFARDRLWATAVEALIRRRYAGRFSVMLLNTWPTDHKDVEVGKVNSCGLSLWDLRRSSLGRLARSALHVQPLPTGCPDDDEWWQWRALSDGVPRPRRRKSIFD